ncbi:N-acetylmuramoyl-L-alanine amidase [Candidatus Pelagibacter sp.]|nr:N-acetylmuramoyl-L-alanine amidase [Candidatus Pelagibacter sp.]|tara:strand:- start:152 stop:880 length:729 start_codon:yes stop_codon:yes gene_type:complete
MRIKILINYSPNFSTYRRIRKNIKYLIYHYTGMISESKAIKRLTDVRSKVSCHYFIKRNGKIILMVPTNYDAWHAGKSNWKKDKSLNKKSIGIEISNNGHQFGYQNFSKKQINSVIRLSKFLIKKYNIKKTNILGHSDIAYERKKDPGEKFPWEHLSKNKIGIWHKKSKKDLKKMRNQKISKIEEKKFFRFIYKIGYFPQKQLSVKKINLVKSFQRHFRQESINGMIDKECLFIAKELVNIK